MNYEEIAFDIIRYSAEAKSMVMQELDNIENGEIKEEQFKEAKAMLVNAHLAHSKLVQTEAAGTKHEFSLLIMHAEDQLMNVELLLDMAARFQTLYKKVN